MSANFETGHARNIANFNQVISICTRMGAEYQPSNPDLSITRMQLLYTHADAAKMALDQVLPAYSLAVTSREEAFKALPKRITKIVSLLVACGVSEGILKDVKSVSRTITNKRKKKKEVQGVGANTSEVVTHNSNLHQSYDNLESNLYRLIQLLKAIPEYMPEEPSLKTTELIALHNTLRSLNNTVVNTSQPVSLARKRRDSFLYANNNGVVPTYRKVKAYVKAIKGISSTEYRDLRALKFSIPKNIDSGLSFTLDMPV